MHHEHHPNLKKPIIIDRYSVADNYGGSLSELEKAEVLIKGYVQELQRQAPPETSAFRKLYDKLVDNLLTGNCTIKELKAIAKIKGHNTPLELRALLKGSLKHFETEHRTTLAQILLRETECSVADIAVMLGCQNENTFTMCFKQKTGLCPSIFRQKSYKSTYGEKNEVG
jgi:AraC-like DNA-binding protein